MKKIKTISKKIFLLLVTCFLMITITNAESAPKTLKITHYTKTPPMSFPATFHVKKTTDGKYSYCTYYAKTPPNQNVGYTKGELITDNGLNYILNQAYLAKTDDNFFIYQTALWIYMVDKGMMPGPYYDLTVFKSQVNNSSSSTANTIKTIVANAKKASANDTKAPTIQINTTNVKFALDSTKKYYVSSKISVTSSTDKYGVTLTSAPAGTEVVKKSNYFYIKVPVEKITNLKTTIKFNVTNSKYVYTSYYYKPSASNYQIMANTFRDTKVGKKAVSLNITKTASIPVLKVDDKTGEAISGAGLQVLNSAGIVIDSWTSTKEARTITGLSEGTYTLKEISEPNGYILSNVAIKFTVGADGKIKNSAGNNIAKIEYKNTKTSVTISKQDITNKQELPGAHLVIKNSAGKEIISWTSSTKRYVIRGLAAGTYTLTEKIAPEGYSLSTETITFKIDKYGKLYNGAGNAVESITMYNAPIRTHEVSISKRDITTNNELPGATLKLTNDKGELIETWVSTTKEHIIKNLKAGTYSLTETIAPEGYILSTETITFKIDENGKLYDKDGKNISKIIMYNQKKSTPGGVSISKQDITNGKELPGATLVVKDYNGKEIETWVSTDKPHLIENLKPGIYTLTETIAPEGYVLSTETITFTIKDDGSITQVVMYNSPNSKDIPVENTASFKTITSSLLGTMIIVAGAYLIFKSSKKKNNI